MDGNQYTDGYWHTTLLLIAVYLLGPLCPVEVGRRQHGGCPTQCSETDRQTVRESVRVRHTSGGPNENQSDSLALLEPSQGGHQIRWATRSLEKARTLSIRQVLLGDRVTALQILLH